MQELIRLREEVRATGEPVLRPKTFDLLLKIAKEKDLKNILEIGTSVGLTGTALLLQNQNARLTGIEIDEEKVKKAKENYKHFNVFDRTKIFLGSAGEIIPILSGEYDLIFLDGPKGHYAEYLPNLLPLLKVGGVLFADDVYFHGFVFGETPKKHNTIKHSLEKYLYEVTNDKNLKTEILDLEDGVSISEKIK